MDADGNTDFVGSVLTSIPQLKTARAQWVRMSIGGGYNAYPDWVTPAPNGTTRTSQVDQVVQAVKAAGLSILGLLDAGTVTGYNQAAWSANSVEAGGGNGDNAFIDHMGVTFGMLSQHYAGQVDAWEVWNEPNVWTVSPGVGGTYIYPSNFAWLLKRIKDAQRDKAPIVSGGIFAFQDSAGLHSGSDYLAATVAAGKSIWSGALPFDSVGQHLYLPLASYQQAISEFTAVTGKPLSITEWGWQTPPATYQQQQDWLGSANSLFVHSAVAGAFWFKLQDSPNLNYGLLDAAGNAKPALTAYQAGVFMDQAIQLLWDSYFLQLQRLFPQANIQLAPKGTGIYHAWYNAVLGGKQLGPATTYEYPITDWAGNPGVGQNFGSCRVEWYSSGSHAYGPYGQIW